MLKLRSLALVALPIIVAVAAVVVQASDLVAVYARVDRVVLTPADGPAKTIQVFGVFSVAKPDDRNEYLEPAKGYLYFTLPGDEALARREWNDLKSVAGTGQIVAFGSRFSIKPRVRAASDAPESPDEYTTGWGVKKVNGDTQYRPIRSLVDYRQ